MRKVSIFLLIAVVFALSFAAVQPAAASTGGTIANGILVKNHDITTTYNRAWSWDIVKTGSVSELLLSLGESGLVNYTVTVSGVPQDSGWSASGFVTFRNMGTTDITVTSVVVDLSGVQVVPTCTTPPGFPPVIHPGYTVECSYTAALPDGSPRTSAATVTTTDTSVSDALAVTFGSPAAVTGQTINVTDSYAGSLGQVTGSANPTTAVFTYSRAVDAFSVCGDHVLTNTAAIVETGASSSWDVTVKVPCAGGCTLTQGYWKTHSQLGPAPYDAGWQNLGALQEQTRFFLSGQTWLAVFNTAPRGNSYYILAHQYMAAKLNVLDGAASTPAVNSALLAAESFFNTYTPSAALTTTVKNQAIANANLLDQFNNGLLGTAHCSE